MHELMGVRVDPVEENISGLKILETSVPLSGRVAAGGQGLVLDGRLNASYKAVNLLLKKGVPVRRVDVAQPGLNPGDFLVEPGSESVFKTVAEETGVDFVSLKSLDPQGTHTVRPPRIGMYQRYWGGNMDEGWTRLVLENFSFPYTPLLDKDIKKGGLIRNYEVIILPNDSSGMIVGDRVQSRGGSMPAYPPEYTSGIGQEGVASLKEFVEQGGTLVTLGEACSFAIEKFGLALYNATDNLNPKNFFCPGSTVKVTFDNQHPLGYGMPAQGLVLNWASPAFAIMPSQNNERYQTVVRYQEKDLLQSGWLIGEEHLANLAGMVDAAYGKGNVVLIGFRTQNRSQTHGTFKLLFNALMR
jgi:hypothetical protein